jgi:hypothetical protein
MFTSYKPFELYQRLENPDGFPHTIILLHPDPSHTGLRAQPVTIIRKLATSITMPRASKAPEFPLNGLFPIEKPSGPGS